MEDMAMKQNYRSVEDIQLNSRAQPQMQERYNDSWGNTSICCS